MSKVNYNFTLGAGLLFVAVGVVVIALTNHAWLWGSGFITLGIALVAFEWFDSFAKVCIISCAVIFLLGLIFQAPW
jgi:hypothetical protein